MPLRPLPGKQLGWGVREAERIEIVQGFSAEGFYDELMIVALGQAGDGDGSDDAGSGDGDREGSAVRRVFVER